jgi:uncharacterized membrane-anchored protein YjiN (DUF445 family)
MPNPADMPKRLSSSEDEEKRVALRRTRAVATASLIFCFLAFLLAKWLQPDYPLLGFVAAFAEAATIGGLADWYAVTALFRRPLGLPIPHTAIIPENRSRIADNLGRFIEANFLAPEPVRRKLREVDFAAMVADWLSEPKRSDDLARFIVRLSPQMLAAVEETGLRGFMNRRMIERLRDIPLAPLAAGFLSSFTGEGRHQKLLDGIIDALAAMLNDEATLASLRGKIREELPTLFNFFRGDAYLLKRIVASAASLFEEVKADAGHPLRKEFDRFARDFIEDLRDSPEYAARADELKREFLQRPEVQAIGASLWQNLRQFVEEDTRSPHSSIRRQLAVMLAEIGRRLAEDAEIRADMNMGFVVAFSAFIESQKSGVSTFIADQVKGWDLKELVRIIEVNVGRDLQYIRFNGMVIGGIAGLVLYTIERFLVGT